MVDSSLPESGPAATVRTVRVKMDAEVAGYIRDVTAAGEATRRAFGNMGQVNKELGQFNQQVDGMSASADRMRSSTSKMQNDLANTSRSMRGLGTSAQQTGQAMTRSANDINRAQSALTSASSKLDAARRQEADTAGRLRVAESALNDLRTKGTQDATKLAAAEERVAAASRAHESALQRVTRAETDAQTAADKLGRAELNVGTNLDRAGRSADRTAQSLKKAGDNAHGANQGMGLLLTSAIALGPALVPLATVAVPATVGLTAGMASAGAAVGVTVLALHGLSNGLKAIDTYNATPTVKNFQAMHAALKDLGPEGAKFVELISQLEPKLKALQNDARSGLLPGLGSSIEKLLPYLPQVESFIKRYSSEMGALLGKGTSNLIDDPGWHKFFAFVKTEGIPTLDAWAKATGNVATGLAVLLSDFGPEVQGFNQGLEDSTKSFKDWAEGLDRNSGSFKAFLDYIHSEGPAARAFFAALIQALVGVLRAAAPWGNTVLPILTDLLKLLAAIAASPVGPMLFTTAAGLMAMSKAMTLFSGASGLRTAISSVGAFGTALKSLRGDLALTRAAASAPLIEGGSAAALPEGYLAARGRMNTLTSGLAAAGKGAAGLAGGALAVNLLTSNHSTGVNLAEGAASGALIGTSIAPGWGTAIGAVVGGLGGLAKSLFSASDAAGKVAVDWSQIDFRLTATGGNTPGTAGSIASGFAAGGTTALAARYGITQQQLVNSVLSGNSTAVKGTLAGAQKSALTSLRDSGFSSTAGGQVKETYDQTRAIASALDKATASYQANKSGAKAAASAAKDYTVANRSAAQAAALAAQKANALVAALQAQHQAELSNANAEIAYHQAVADAATQAGKHTKGLNLNTAAGRANATALYNLVSAYNAQDNATKNSIKGYENARAHLVTLAHEMGLTSSQTQHLIGLFDSPPRLLKLGISPVIYSEINAFEARLAAATRSRTVYVNVHTSATHSGSPGTGAGGSADGSTVPKGGTYADRFPYLLAPGEEVISNRNGQADRWRPFLKAINAGRLAGGGTAGSSSSSSSTTGGHLTMAYVLNAQQRYDLGKQITDLTAEHKKLTLAISNLTKQLGKAESRLQNVYQQRTALSQQVQAGLTRDLLSPPQAATAFSPGFGATVAPYASITSGLRTERKNAKDMTGLERKLRGRGLSTGAIAYIMSAPDPLAAAREFDHQTNAQLRSFSTLYRSTTRAITTAGNTAGNIVYGHQVAIDKDQVQDIKDTIKTEGVKDRAVMKQVGEDNARKSAKYATHTGSKSARSKRYTHTPKKGG